MHRSRLGDEARRPLGSISRQHSQTSASGDSGRSRSRSPHSHSSCSSKEEMLWLDYQLAMRLQREADRPCTVEDTLDEEQIREILGPDSDYYLPTAGDLPEVFLDDRIRTRSSSRTTHSHSSVEHQPLDDTDEANLDTFQIELDTVQEVYADEFTLPLEEGEADDDTRARLSVSEDGDGDENNDDDDDDDDDDDEDDDDSDEEDDGSNANENDSDEDDDDDGDGNDEVQEEDNEGEGADDSDAEDLNATRVIVRMDSDSDGSTASVLTTDDEEDEIETLNRRLDRLRESLQRFREMLRGAMEIDTRGDELESNSGLTGSEGTEGFAEDENDDSVIRSDFFGRCTICFEEVPYDPVGCLYCQQMIGCRRCVTRWYMAAERERETGFDIMGGHPPSNHKQCPLCRHQWEEQVEVTSMFLLRDDFP